MLGMDIGELIHRAVIGLYNGRGFPSKALYMAFDIRCSYYGDREARETCSLHYLFNRPWGSSGPATTNTFAAVHDDPFAKLSDIEEWEFLSSHESGWRDAAKQKAGQVERLLYTRVMKSLGYDEKNYPSIKELHWMTSFPTFNANFYDWIPVRITKDLSDKNNYKKLIQVLRKTHEQEESISA